MQKFKWKYSKAHLFKNDNIVYKTKQWIIGAGFTVIIFKSAFDFPIL